MPTDPQALNLPGPCGGDTKFERLGYATSMGARMEVLSTILTILNIVDKSRGAYDWFTGVSKGDQLKQALGEIENTKAEVRRLSDHVLWAPEYVQVSPRSISPTLLSPAEADIVQRLDAGQRLASGDILISAVAETPSRLRASFDNNPFEVLFDARPEHRAVRPPDADMIPIRFSEGGQTYIGWQKRGALPSMFDCDFHTEPTQPVLQRAGLERQQKSFSANNDGNQFPASHSIDITYLEFGLTETVLTLSRALSGRSMFHKGRLHWDRGTVTITLSHREIHLVASDFVALFWPNFNEDSKEISSVSTNVESVELRRRHNVPDLQLFIEASTPERRYLTKWASKYAAGRWPSGS